MALRHAYGGSLVRTLAKELGIGVIYYLTSIIAFITMIYIVSVMA